jgi:hypothetical protein
MFDIKSPRISAFNIHEWIFETLKLAEEDLYMIQIDGPRRHVYIKFKNAEQVHTVLNESEGQRENRHDNGVISKVKIEPAGMGIKTIRIANLPPEVNERGTANILSRYGEVKDLRDEAWSKSYRYKISNGIRIATMNLKEHIPSYMTIASHKVLISYEGQPATCYGCNNTGHQFQDCPTRRVRTQRPLNQAMTPWTEIV